MLVEIAKVVLPAVLAFAAVMLAKRLDRKSSTEAEDRARGEELMRSVRWACELAASDDERDRRLGARLLVDYDSGGLEAYDDDLRTLAQQTITAGLETLVGRSLDDAEGADVVVELDPESND